MTITLQVTDMFVFCMKMLMCEVCPKGDFDVEMYFEERTLSYHMLCYAKRDNERIPVQTQVINYELLAQFDIKKFSPRNVLWVDDTTKATLMLLYGD